MYFDRRMPDNLNPSRKDTARLMTALRRDRLITGVSALLASLAVHAVLFLAGYMLYEAYFTATAETSQGILFATRIDRSPEEFLAGELQDTLGTEGLVEAAIGASDVLRFDASELDDPTRLLGVIRSDMKFQTVEPGFGPGISDPLFARPEILQPELAGNLGEVRKAGDVLGDAADLNSAASVFGTGFENGIKNRDVLLVWLVDSSPSMFDQIETLKRHIRPLFDRMNRSCSGRLKMTVVGYAAKAELLLEKPTTDPVVIAAVMDSIKAMGLNRLKEKALARYENPRRRMHPDVENTMRALRETTTLKADRERQIVIALLTDERGDDADDWQKALGALQAKKIPLIVFGPTTRMLSETRDELAVIKDGVFARKPANPQGYALVVGSGDLGSAGAGREPCCRDWGAALFGTGLEQPVIAGPFELSALVKLTGGKYFFIDDGKAAGAAVAAGLPADARKLVNEVAGDRKKNSAEKFDLSLMGGYIPEYFPKERAIFMKSFGRRFRDIVVEFEKMPKPPSKISTAYQMRNAARGAVANIATINRTIKKVNSLKAGPEVPRRWLAYRDLFLAQLYVARYNLTEYLNVLERTSTKNLSAMPDSRGFVRRLELRQAPLGVPSKDLPVTEAVEIPTMEPVRIVIRSRRELDDFLKNRAALGENQEIPEVNFARQMLIIASLGRVYSPGAEVEILCVAQLGDALEIVLRENNPRAVSRNPDKPYFPSYAVVVPRSSLAPKYVSLEQWGKARIAEETPILKGGRMSAKYRQDAKIAVDKVLRRYRGTPWAEVAKGMRTLGTFEFQEKKAKLSEDTPTPRIQEDF